MPSTSDSRQPYRLSDLDLVTESLTLIAGNLSRPSFAIWYRRFTPVVVSSETPLIWAMRLEYQPGCAARRFLIDAKRKVSSSLAGRATAEESDSALVPRCRSSVAS